jgi:hypothetical protein
LGMLPLLQLNVQRKPKRPVSLTEWTLAHQVVFNIKWVRSTYLLVSHISQLIAARWKQYEYESLP